MNVIIFKNVNNAKKYAQENGNSVAVEAEYGNRSLEMGDEGVVYEMNHHGSKQHFSAPCSRFEEHGNFKDSNFVVSHLDLDTIMGIGVVCGLIKKNKKNKSFGEIAEFVDNYGIHRIEEKDNLFLEELDNFQFHLEKNKKYFKEGENISGVVRFLINKLNNILENGSDTEELLEFHQNKVSLIESLEIKELCSDKLRVFKTDNISTISQYDYRNLIIQYNSRYNTITLSCYNEDIAIKLFGNKGVLIPLREYFGENSGGKYSIGGGDRNKKYNIEDVENFVNFINKNYNL